MAKVGEFGQWWHILATGQDTQRKKNSRQPRYATDLRRIEPFGLVDLAPRREPDEALHERRFLFSRRLYSDNFTSTHRGERLLCAKAESQLSYRFVFRIEMRDYSTPKRLNGTDSPWRKLFGKQLSHEKYTWFLNSE